MKLREIFKKYEILSKFRIETTLLLPITPEFFKILWHNQSQWLEAIFNCPWHSAYRTETQNWATGAANHLTIHTLSVKLNRFKSKKHFIQHFLLE
jgi:hypothetical protein